MEPPLPPDIWDIVHSYTHDPVEIRQKGNMRALLGVIGMGHLISEMPHVELVILLGDQFICNLRTMISYTPNPHSHTSGIIFQGPGRSTRYATRHVHEILVTAALNQFVWT